MCLLRVLAVRLKMTWLYILQAPDNDEPDGYPDPADPEFDMPTHIVDRTAKLCGMTREALLSRFCTGAQTSKDQRDWDLAVQYRPKEGKKILI